MRNQIINELFEKRTLTEQDSRGAIYELSDNDEKLIEVLQPGYNAKLLLAEYYRQKYGVRILVISTEKEVNEVIVLIKSLQKTKEDHKFGVILSSFRGASMPSFIKDPQYLHVCPFVYEKCGQSNTIIVLDGTDMMASNAGFHKRHRNILKQVQKRTSIRVFAPEVKFQRDLVSCHTYSLVELVNALRFENLAFSLENIQQLKLAEDNLFLFSQVPESLLKADQIQFLSSRLVNMNANITRSSSKKPSKTLEEFKSKNIATYFFKISGSDKKVAVKFDSTLIKKAQKNPDRIIKLLTEHYPGQSIQLVIERLKQQQDEFLKQKIPSSTIANPSLLSEKTEERLK